MKFKHYLWGMPAKKKSEIIANLTHILGQKYATTANADITNTVEMVITVVEAYLADVFGDLEVTFKE